MNIPSWQLIASINTLGKRLDKVLSDNLPDKSRAYIVKLIKDILIM